MLLLLLLLLLFLLLLVVVVFTIADVPTHLMCGKAAGAEPSELEGPAVEASIGVFCDAGFTVGFNNGDECAVAIALATIRHGTQPT